MPVENLNDSRVRGLTHSDGELIDIKSGLLIRADRAGAVTFSFRYRAGGARRRIVLGRYPAMSLSAARIAAAKVREQARNGIDPQTERRARREAPAGLSFDALCELYLENYAKKAKASWKQDESLLRLGARTVWGKREAATITRRDAAQLLYELANRAPVTANRLRSVLRRMFGWAIDSALLDHDHNPLTDVRKPHREHGKTRVLNDAEIAVLWRAFEATSYLPSIIAALKCLLLLGQRPAEICGMAADELHYFGDGSAALWVIPAYRTKTRKAHAVPLPALARTIIQNELARHGRPDFVFVGRYSVGQQHVARTSMSAAMLRIIADLDDTDADAVASLRASRPTPHDLRRTLASGLSRLGIPREDRLAVLGHAHADVHERHYDHYNRLPERRRALEIWERHVRRVISGEPDRGAEIVTLRHAKAPS